MKTPATNSANLIVRAASNTRYSEIDFDGWVSDILAELRFTSVLDLCCGTGNQLTLFGAQPGIEYVAGVDISQEALTVAEERVAATGAPHELTNAPMEHAFTHPAIAGNRFDLVSCFYGLYHARDPRATLVEMIEHARETILVVGPYGHNNAAFFALMQRHFTLPERLVWSSTSFMEDTVAPTMEAKGLQVETRKLATPVRFPSAVALLDYWRVSTFSDPAYEPAVAADIDAHFKTHDSFVIEKHVMALIGRKPQGPA